LSRSGVGKEEVLGRKGRPRLRRLREELVRAHPKIDNPEQVILRGLVLVGGRVITNPSSLVREGSFTIRQGKPLRGEAKLRAALRAFKVDVCDRIALDIGAAAGGFSRVLLDAGARRVYAVDAGHGQLLGSLRQDPCVVNLEATNLGDLDRGKVPDIIDVVTIDISYLALAAAVPQLERVGIAASADAIALVKPQFELGLPRPPEDPEAFREAVRRASAGFDSGGWNVMATVASPVRGSRGAVEFLLHAVRMRGHIARRMEMT
jgi:23S rRNA (cytidine1920-2'-O)/16S rRNA (cytidine1409-2'-O)-methyltransferase